MTLNTRILMTDGTVVKKQVKVDDTVSIGNALAIAGSRLRAEDPNVAAVRCDEIKKRTWVGDYSPEHEAAKVDKERSGVKW